MCSGRWQTLRVLHPHRKNKRETTNRFDNSLGTAVRRRRHVVRRDRVDIVDDAHRPVRQRNDDAWKASIANDRSRPFARREPPNDNALVFEESLRLRFGVAREGDDRKRDQQRAHLMSSLRR